MELAKDEAIIKEEGYIQTLEAMKEIVLPLIEGYLGEDIPVHVKNKIRRKVNMLLRLLEAESLGEKELRNFYRAGRLFLLFAFPDRLLLEIYRNLREYLQVSQRSKLLSNLEVAFRHMIKPYILASLMDEEREFFENMLHVELVEFLMDMRKYHIRHSKKIAKALLEGFHNAGSEKIIQECKSYDKIEHLKSYLEEDKDYKSLMTTHALYHQTVKFLLNRGSEDFESLYDAIVELDRVSKSLTDSIDRLLLKLLNNLAFVDSLTGLYTRTYLEHILRRELNRSLRAGFPISLMVVDIDNFKKVNDTFGHEAGDLLLKKAGQLILKTIRAGDIAIRYGGEEFIIILPHTSLEGAGIVAERLRKTFEGLELSYKGHVIKATVSIGVVQIMNFDEPAKDIERADMALYRAKREGKNRVVVLDAN